VPYCRSRIIGALAACVGALTVSAPAIAQLSDTPVIRYRDTAHPVLGNAGMVATQNPYASAAGARVLENGGNAVDAAVAIGFALAVSYPRAGNLGGGGFMLVHTASDGLTSAIDYREMAPHKASRHMYLDEDGEVDRARSFFSHLAAGVPGTVAGMWHAHQRFGKLPWKDLLRPAIDLARDGIEVSYDMSVLLATQQERLCRNPTTCNYFFKDDGTPYQPGDRLIQADLARTLELIAEHGARGFYEGETARKIADEMAQGGGLVDLESLRAYEVIVREPVAGDYRGWKVVTMPPPSSGGVHVLQMLNILERFDVTAMGSESADSVHLLAEVARLAYADRSRHLGDPDYFEVPVAWLISKDYGKQLAGTIDLQRARPSSEVLPGAAPAYESADTTHYSVIDRHGNVVANTYTLNFTFGSGISVDGAGFLLNNEMADFVARPDTPNAFGLLGGDANVIESGKRPLSSMTPTLLFGEDGSVIATGSMGGSRIIMGVLQTIVNIVDHGMNIAEAAAAPRMHHQWLPDKLQLEPGFSPDTIRILLDRGHEVLDSRYSMGSTQTVSWQDGLFRGASDPRRPESATIAPGE
jgi:gamma-glutamyltranspeptidase/glutathione hydrolase